MHPTDVVGCGGLDICEVRFFGPYDNAGDAGVGGTGSLNNCGPCFVTTQITLTEFTASNEGDYNHIGWKWETAIDFDRFEVEHSKDGITFNSIYAIALDDMNEEARSHSYRHNNFAEMNYYRLKMIDIDTEIDQAWLRPKEGF